MRLLSIIGSLLCLFPWSGLSQAVPLKVGVSVPLTGDLAAYGSAVRNGIALAVEESKELSQQTVFIVEDNQYSASKALSVFNKFISKDRVDLVYNWGESTLYPIAPLAQKLKIPVLAMSVDPEPAVDRSYVVRTINRPDQFAQTMWSYMRDMGFRKVGIVKTEDPFLNSMVSALKRQIRTDEELQILHSALPDQNDYRLAVSRIKARRDSVDILGVYLLSGQVGAFYRQVGAQSLDIPSFGTDIFENQTEIRSAHGFMDEAVYPNLDVPQTFTSRYTARFADNSEIAFAYNAYIVAHLAGLAAVSGATEPEEILGVLLNPTQHGGNMPFVVRNAAGTDQFYEFPLVMRRIRDGSIETIQQ